MFFHALFIGRLTLPRANECPYFYSTHEPDVKNIEDVTACIPVIEFCFQNSLTTKIVSQILIVTAFSVSISSVWMKLASYNVCKCQFEVFFSFSSSVRINPLNVELKSYLPFAGIIRSSPYSPR
jgi:hypothetical protein